MNNQDFIEHYGIKGMRWKNHKQDDRIINVGTKIHNISSDKPRTSNHMLYVSYKNRDNLNYKGYFGQTLTFYGASKIFDNTFEVKKDILVPSDKKAVETFTKLYKKDRKGMSRELAKAHIETSIFLKLGSMMGMKLEDKAFKKYSKMGERSLQTKGFQDFMQAMPILDKSRTKYFDSLIKEGYDGVVDYNDTKVYGSKDPLIIFKGNKNLKRVNSVEVSAREMNLAVKQYERIVAKENINKLIGRKKEY